MINIRIGFRAMNRIIVTDKKKAPMGDFYGIFFEDINHAADGGLYAEMIRNRSFEFSPIDNPSYNGLTAWNEYEPEGTKVSLHIDRKDPMYKENPHYLVMDVKTDGAEAGVRNEGYNSGIPLYKDKSYYLKICARAAEGTVVRAALVSVDGRIYDSAAFSLSEDWREYKAKLTSDTEDFSARLMLSMNRNGKACFDLVSLFPEDTYKSRKNGLRRDIAEYLEALKPKFVRFPGGCLIHDGSLNKDDRDANYRWKNSIGPLQKRAARRNNWRYNQTLGLGYYEYFLFCEDIGAEPLPVLPAGYNPHSKQGVPFDELGEWIDDALDLIEFANGDADTEWGSVRAELGHPGPFGLKYIAIGNEEVGQGFFDRYDFFHKAIRERYPEIKIINSAGPFNHGSEYDRGWTSAEKNGSDIIDEHYYMTPEWFIANCHRYDDFSGDGTKVFLGEYASWDNKYRNALAEAAFMTGLENDAHAVALVCYAPLLCNAQYVNWEPDMIWFDNHRVFGSANYYVQKLFMTNLPSYLLETKREGLDKTYAAGPERIEGGISIAADRCGAVLSDIRVTNDDTGEVMEFGVLTDADGEAELCSVYADKYTLELTARRICGELGFKISFGSSGERSRYVWSVGGWQNQDCCIDKLEGHASCLTQSRFTVETGIEYRLRLEVSGRGIKTYINGIKMNDVIDKRQINEELYFTAGIDDETGEIIVKAVNINEMPVVSTVEYPFGGRAEAEVSELSGYSLEDKNSFEEPEKIYPKTKSIIGENGSFEYEFPPLSVTVFRIRNTK